MNSQQSLEHVIPLDRKAHRHAQLFASEQLTPQKGKKVYLNTLAVYAVQTYLKWLDFEADIEQSYTWHPGVRATFDVADLLIPGVGRLECRPVPPGETVVSLPGEMAFNSPDEVVGYIAVQFHEKLDSVVLKGFLPASEVADDAETVQLSALKSMDSFLTFLPSKSNNSKKWHEQLIDRLCEIGWELYSGILTTPGITPASSGSSRCVENLKWTVDLEEAGVVSVWLTSEEESETTEKLLLKITPESTQTLPSNLELALVSSNEEIVSCSGEGEGCLELGETYVGTPGSHLYVRVSLGEKTELIELPL